MLKSLNVNRETCLYFHSFIATWKVQELLLIAARGPLSLFSICGSGEKKKKKKRQKFSIEHNDTEELTPNTQIMPQPAK